MLNKAYDAIKSADRDNPEEVIVISGAPRATGFFNGDCAPTGCDDAPFLQGMVSAGADEFMDCVGIRYLEGAAGPDVQAAGLRGHSTHYSLYYPTMVAIYSNAFPDKPLCFTGLGYFAPPEQAALSPQYAWAANTTSEDQARWLGRAVEVARTSRLVQIMIIQNVDATVASNGLELAGYAMIRSDGTCSACNRVRAALR
jgi:hypothetical protein